MVLIINQLIIISIHALREEGDGVSHHVQQHSLNFYPRPP